MPSRVHLPRGHRASARRAFAPPHFPFQTIRCLGEIDELFDKLRAEYLAQLPDTLRRLERQILEWPANQPAPQGVLRDVHSLKGSGGTYGLDFITTVCHSLEDFFHRAKPRELDHETLQDHVLSFVHLITAYAEAIKRGSTPEGFAEKLQSLSLDAGAKRVLVVEPGHTMATVFEELLSSQGIQVSIQPSGYHALGRLTREHYDGRLTSYETTDICGLSLASAARAIQEIPETLKVILVTSNRVSILGDTASRVDEIIRKDRELPNSLENALRATELLPD